MLAGLNLQVQAGQPASVGKSHHYWHRIGTAGAGRELPLSLSCLNGSSCPFAFSNVPFRSVRQSTLSTVQPPITIRELSAQSELSFKKPIKLPSLEGIITKMTAIPL